MEQESKQEVEEKKPVETKVPALMTFADADSLCGTSFNALSEFDGYHLKWTV